MSNLATSAAKVPFAAEAERRRSKLEPLMMWNITESKFSNSDCSVDLLSKVLSMVSKVESALIVRLMSLLSRGGFRSSPFLFSS